MRCYFCKSKNCPDFGSNKREFTPDDPCPDYDDKSDVLDVFSQSFNDIDDYD